MSQQPPHTHNTPPQTQQFPEPGEPQFGAFHKHAFFALYLKETRRFLKIPGQTVVAPLVNVLLFFLVFSIAVGQSRTGPYPFPFAHFLAPGLITMAVIQNAFSNTSSALLMAKVQNNLTDYLLPPFSPSELLLGMTLAGVTRGLFVGAITWIGSLFFAPLVPQHFLILIFNLGAASLAVSLFGVLAGLMCEKFDHLATITNFVLTPLVFLSGTFYSIQALPPALVTFSLFNPVFHFINGVRYGLTGYSDAPILYGVISAVIVNAALWSVAYIAVRRGWRIKT